jgi:2-C-methyl-D-erythritol 4-phosphate cytidylyltransferase
MIVVGGGSSTRFGTDKLLAVVAGRPLISHTIESIAGHVDTCVVVCRAEVLAILAPIVPGATLARGGATRTLSEVAGLDALGAEYDLIGIHDAARPVVGGELVERLFTLAGEVGGAVPLLQPDRMILDRRTHRPVDDLARAQTPQVFRGADLMVAYAKAAQTGFEGHDTVDVVQEFTDLAIVGVPGESSNVKVTYPSDLDQVARALPGSSHT